MMARRIAWALLVAVTALGGCGGQPGEDTNSAEAQDNLESMTANDVTAVGAYPSAQPSDLGRDAMENSADSHAGPPDEPFLPDNTPSSPKQKDN